MKKWLVLPLLVAILLMQSVVSGETITVLWRDQQGDLDDHLVEKFEAAHPGLKVNLIRSPHNELDDKLIMMLASGLNVDLVAEMSLMNWGFYAYDGLFADLTPFIERDYAQLDVEGLLPLWNQMTMGSRIVGLPFNGWLGASITYNATLFQEAALPLPTTSWTDPSWNWQAFLDAARKLTVRDAADRITQLGVSYWLSDLTVCAFSWAHGGDVFPAEAYATGFLERVIFNTPANQRAFSALVDLTQEFQVANPTGLLPATISANLTAFGQGSIGMWLDSGLLRTDDILSPNYQWGLAPLPIVDERTRVPAFLNAVALINTSPHPDAAWEFAKFLISEGVTVRPGFPGIRASSWLAAIEEATMSGLYINTRQELEQLLMEGFQYTVPVPRYGVRAASDVIDILLSYLQQAINGEISVEEALTKAEEESNALLVLFNR